MCGFVGAVWTGAGDLPDRALFEKATEQLAHRGPDEAGYYFSEQDSPSTCWLGHRRLSIIDLQTGRQPITNEMETLQLVCNGEIYNYRELSKELLSRGHQFRTQSDSEVILHLYEEYGERCVEFLNGMFAFAIWDERAQKLFIARDRMGQKPLFYREEQGRFLFASELKAIRPLSHGPASIDPVALDLYLRYQYVPHTHCLLNGYEQLPPAFCGSWKNGELKLSRYWFPPYDEPFEETPESCRKVSQELRGLIEDSVRLRLRSDVPVGTFLSGGVDSTLITGLVSKQIQDPVKTFSISFAEPEYDESEYARLVARKFQTEHVQETVQPDLISLLPRLVWHYDQPFGDSSAIPTFYLSQLTRQNVTVSLTGDGGDELFAGYERYRAVGLADKLERLPVSLKRMLAARIWQKFPTSTRYRSPGRRIKRFLSEMNASPWERYFRWISIFREEQLQGLYTTEFQQQLSQQEMDPIKFLTAPQQFCANRDLTTQITCSDLQTYLPGDILTKLDIASMSHGLECRSPFLDYRVVELAARMPISWKRSGKRGKKILTETFSDLLPDSIINRPKMGFGVPINYWFRHELKDFVSDILMSETARGRGIFNSVAVERIWHEHQKQQLDHSARIWLLLCLEMWFRTWIDQTAPTVNEVSV